MPSPKVMNEKLGFFWREKTHSFFHHLQGSVSSRKIQVASWRYILACKLCLISYNSCTIGSGNRDHITRGIKVLKLHVSPKLPPIMAQRFPPKLSNNKHPNYPCWTLEIICWQSCNIHKSPNVQSWTIIWAAIKTLLPFDYTGWFIQILYTCFL